MVRNVRKINEEAKDPNNKYNIDIIILIIINKSNVTYKRIPINVYTKLNIIIYTTRNEEEGTAYQSGKESSALRLLFNIPSISLLLVDKNNNSQPKNQNPEDAMTTITQDDDRPVIIISWSKGKRRAA